MRLLVTGGRDFTDRERLWRTLYVLKPEVLIHGAACGADKLAMEWCRDWNLIKNLGRGGMCTEIAVPIRQSEWDMLGGYAGPARNKRMLDWQPELVLACPGGRGTADMIERARDAGIPVVGLL